MAGVLVGAGLEVGTGLDAGDALTVGSGLAVGDAPAVGDALAVADGLALGEALPDGADVGFPIGGGPPLVVSPGAEIVRGVAPPEPPPQLVKISATAK